ncbi:unnamed protein product [Pseudo-nitzschia multistriata]|uniref:Uncharacterized protein n=1 Tax=Pseudo-nitzschia multistriata TaxID=183589 RepID=A0A448YYV7_9STRA|nr:unnamed protein product [Pseudo-nitzschia multistriata]
MASVPAEGPKTQSLWQRQVSMESSPLPRLNLRKKTSYFLFSFVLTLILRIDPLFSFTAESKTTARSKTTSILPLPLSSKTKCVSKAKSPIGRSFGFSCIDHQHGSASASSTSWLSMTKRARGNRDFFDDDEDFQTDDYYYYQDTTGAEAEAVGDYAGVDTDDDYDDYYNSSSYYEDDDNNREEMNRRRTVDYYDDDIDEYGDERTNGGESDGDGNSNSRGGYYQVSFNEEVDPSETEIDWEICTSNNRDKKTPQALVLLPPAAVKRPKAIVHFVGGTVFGSNPKLWYRGLLESIVRSTSVAIVVTPIPVTLFQNPLQHVRLSLALRSSFRNAWQMVLEDEYGPEALEGIPLCGLGHSLGARLLTVMTTLDQNEPLFEEESTRSSVVIPPYKSLCLVSFTNYGAKVGIPGVGALLKQSKKREAYNNNNNNRSPRSRRGRSSNNGRRNKNRYDDFYDDEEALDEEWAEMVEDFQETFSAQKNRIQTALTPNSKDLEFLPTPDQLWKALAEDDRYRVNTTLVVQFDDDPIDQGSKLATLLHSTNSSDVRFARLRGNHLTPVSAYGEGSQASESSASAAAPLRPRRRDAALQSLLETAFKGTQKNRRDKVALRDLRLSLVSYITDVVAK